ncbi:MAG: efflux transporter outer membrane subunit [Desulfobulbaceae bacterium]|nr:efflux transporter outer membrane subunit [Desulfobulbaceae bacterium]
MLTNPPTILRCLLLLLATAILSGCSFGPDYVRPDLELPATFRGSDVSLSDTSFGDRNWRTVYSDPTLQALIEEALTAAPDLLLAEARIREAEAVAGITHADRLPQLSLSFATSPTARQPGDDLTSTFLGGAAISWEIDLWGRMRRADEAARAELLAREEAGRGVYITLISQVATGYYRLLAEHDLLAVATRTANNQRESLHLIERLSAAGIATDAEIRQQEVVLAVTEATIPAQKRRIANAENALSILLGRSPGSVLIKTGTEPDLPADIPAGLPSQLLEKRPDIMAAEQQLIAANARIGEAKARFFPSLSLTGLFGQVSTSASDVLTGSAASVASLGAGALQPLFAGKRLLYNHEAARIRLDQALISYRKTILTALAEVANSLTNYRYSADILSIQQQRAASAREALRLAESRYQVGVISYIEVLDAQRQLFAAETELVQARLDRRLTLISLYLSLGGGWEN